MNPLLALFLSVGSFFAGRYSATNEYENDMKMITTTLKQQVVETGMVLEQSRTLIDYIYNKEF